ncbi:hypothetical protein MRB53_038513 [Persea americana]|nr:hypothetical protein MRB53_038513 [Persea americana]
MVGVPARREIAKPPIRVKITLTRPKRRLCRRSMASEAKVETLPARCRLLAQRCCQKYNGAIAGVEWLILRPSDNDSPEQGLFHSS